MAVATRQLQSTTLRQAAQHVITGARTDYDPLMDLIGGAHFVLIGEASRPMQEP